MPFSEKLQANEVLVIDGALATELEARGCDLNQSLWSAVALDRHPALIRDVHRAYLTAGADCITTASYQASVPGFRAAGYDVPRSEELYRQSIRLAYETRAEFCRERQLDVDGVDAPLVATSIGPYGAYLADGSEYRGNYPVSAAELAEFHGERIALALDELKAHTDQPLLAFETIPSLEEARTLIAALAAHPGAQAWLSFSCGSPRTVCEGQSIAECLLALEAADGIVAVGANCVAPELVVDLAGQFAASGQAVIAYPNAGGSYDASTRQWSTDGSEVPGPMAFDAWSDAGARVLGGCCRTTPAWVAALVAWRGQRR